MSTTNGRKSDAEPNAAGSPIPIEEPRIRRAIFSGEPEVVIRGVVQSVSPAEALGRPSYWAEMIPDVRPERALILGLGAGTIAALLTQRFGPLPITGVDLNPRIVETGYEVCGLAGVDLTFVQADAFEFVETADARYDYIAVDLYVGGDLATGVFHKPFLRRLKALTGPRGTVAFNIIRTRRYERQMTRLHELFATVTTSSAGLNVVAFCRTA